MKQEYQFLKVPEVRFELNQIWIYIPKTQFRIRDKEEFE